MKFVVDANVLFALAKPDSAANNILSAYKLKLVAPDFALMELLKYKDELVAKSGVSSFEKIISSLKNKVVFVDKGEYKDLIKKADKLISDEKDVAYLALALRLFFPIWSNDPHFKEQSQIEVFTTKDLIELLA